MKPILAIALPAWKNDSRFESGQKWFENNHHNLSV